MAVQTRSTQLEAYGETAHTNKRSIIAEHSSLRRSTMGGADQMPGLRILKCAIKMLSAIRRESIKA